MGIWRAACGPLREGVRFRADRNFRWCRPSCLRDEHPRVLADVKSTMLRNFLFEKTFQSRDLALGDFCADASRIHVVDERRDLGNDEAVWIPKDLDLPKCGSHRFEAGLEAEM